MGGTPWTSKACKNCKISKVKCDLQKPQCGRCVRRRTQCPGYEEQKFFVRTYSQMEGPIQRRNQSKFEDLVARKQSTRMLLTVDTSAAICVQMSSTYINDWFQMDSPQSSGIDLWFGKYAWWQIFTHIQQIPKKSQMLERAVTAISMVCLGKRGCDEKLLEQGVYWYNASIRHLLRLIQRNALSEEIVYATIIFQMLELWYSPYGIEAFSAHMNGTNICLRKLSRTQTSTPVMKIIARNQRRLTTLALTIRNNLNSVPEYIGPFEVDTPIDELFQFFTPISNLICNANMIESSNCQAAKSIMNVALEYRQGLLSWYAQSKVTLGVPFHTPVEALPPDEHSSTYLFGAPYSFQSFDSAALHVVYWTSLILVEEVIQKARAVMLPWHGYEEFAAYKEIPIGHERSEFYADEICRSIPYCLEGARGAWGISTLTGCLTQIVRPYVALRRREKLNYCLGVYELALNNGMGMAKGMADYILYMWESYRPPTGTGKPPALQPQPPQPIAMTSHVFENNRDLESHSLVEASKHPEKLGDEMPWRVFQFVQESPSSQ